MRLGRALSPSFHHLSVVFICSPFDITLVRSSRCQCCEEVHWNWFGVVLEMCWTRKHQKSSGHDLQNSLVVDRMWTDGEHGMWSFFCWFLGCIFSLCSGKIQASSYTVHLSSFASSIVPSSFHLWIIVMCLDGALFDFFMIFCGMVLRWFAIQTLKTIWRYFFVGKALYDDDRHTGQWITSSARAEWRALIRAWSLLSLWSMSLNFQSDRTVMPPNIASLF